MYFESVSSSKGNKSKNKQDLIKLKSFCRAKGTICKTKRQLAKWERIFANDVTDKRLVSKFYKKLIQLNIKKKKSKQPNFKMGRRCCHVVLRSVSFHSFPLVPGSGLGPAFPVWSTERRRCYQVEGLK